MRSRVVGGIVGGIVAGIVFGVMMQIMKAPDGSPVMGMVAKVVRSDSLLAGWIYHLFNSTVIGVIFAVILGKRVHGYLGGAGIGAAYGFAWWVLGGLILMPLALEMAPFAPLTAAEMRGIGMGSLMGHLIYGMILGLIFARLYRPEG